MFSLKTLRNASSSCCIKWPTSLGFQRDGCDDFFRLTAHRHENFTLSCCGSGSCACSYRPQDDAISLCLEAREMLHAEMVLLGTCLKFMLMSDRGLFTCCGNISSCSSVVIQLPHGSDDVAAHWPTSQPPLAKCVSHISGVSRCNGMFCASTPIANVCRGVTVFQSAPRFVVCRAATVPVSVSGVFAEEDISWSRDVAQSELWSFLLLTGTLGSSPAVGGSRSLSCSTWPFFFRQRERHNPYFSCT